MANSIQVLRLSSLTRRAGQPLITALLCILLGATAGNAAAQVFPSRPVTVIVPFPPGGGADSLIRILAPRLSALWGQTVIVENKPGASGHIGADQVAKSSPDGHTLVMATTAAISDKNVNQFTAVSLVSADAYVITLHPGVPVKSVSELIAYAKANPTALKFGSSGIGAASHLSAELFKAKAGIEMLHVPYKGTGQAVTDLLAGHIQILFAPAQTVMPHLQSGKLKAIAVTGKTPLTALPNVPPATSTGLPGYQAEGWFGLLAPVATPAAIADKLHGDVAKVMAMPEVRQNLQTRGAEAGNMTRAEFGRFIRDEQEKWAKLMKDAGITAQ